MLESPDHIGIIRLSAIGDVAMASPLIHALRARFPDSRITWLAQPEVTPLLASHPELDAVLPVPVAAWRNAWKHRHWRILSRSLLAFRRELRAQRFALMLDPQGLFKSGLLAWLSGAPRRIGVDSREGSRFLLTEVIDSGPDKSRISSEYLALAHYLGLPTDDGFPMRVAIAQTDQEWAAVELQHRGLDGRLIALVPFTTRAHKHWIAERWAALASKLDAIGFACVILGAPADREQAERIRQAAASANVHNFAGATTLGQAVAVIAHAAGAVGVDTGLTHVAIARGIPTIALFGSTLPYTETNTTRTRVIYHPQACSPCRRRPTCAGVFYCMQAITVTDVQQALLDVLGMSPA